MFEISKQKRKIAGKALFIFVSNHRELIIESKDLGTLYVSKDKNTKGQQSFDKEKFADTRVIKYMKNKDFRKTWSNYIYYWVQLLGGELTNQYGFIPKRGVKDIIKEKQDAYIKNKILYTIDMSNAFGQISYNQLYFYLRKGLFLNAQDAKILAQSMTYKGFMYQGHPLSPIFFNLHLNKSIIRLKGLCDDIYAYADDVTLFFKNGISRRIRVLVHKILMENDLKCNMKKNKIKRIRGGVSGLGFTFLFDKTQFKARNLAKLKRLVKFYCHKLNSGIIPDKSKNVKIFLDKFRGYTNFIKDMDIAQFTTFKKNSEIYVQKRLFL